MLLLLHGATLEVSLAFGLTVTELLWHCTSGTATVDGPSPVHAAFSLSSWFARGAVAVAGAVPVPGGEAAVVTGCTLVAVGGAVGAEP